MVLLRQLDGDKATLAGANGSTLQVALADLAPLWHGEVATLWKAPPTCPPGATWPPLWPGLPGWIGS